MEIFIKKSPFWKAKYLPDEVTEKYEGNPKHSPRQIYAIVFPSLNSVYFGLTKQKIKARIGEHKRYGNPLLKKAFKKAGDKFIVYLTPFVSAADAQGFEKFLISIYLYSKKWNVLNQSFGGSLGNIENFWDEKEICKVALLYPNRTDFQNGHSGAHGAAKRLGIYEKVTAHMTDTPTYWEKNPHKIIEAAKASKTKSDFEINFGGAYNAAKKLNIFKDISIHFSGNKDWLNSPNEIFKVAKYMNNPTEFHQNYSGAYKAAKQLGIFEKVTKHMTSTVRWTKNPKKIYEVARKCESVAEFCRENRSAYRAAKKLGILKYVCAHMTIPPRNVNLLK